MALYTDQASTRPAPSRQEGGSRRVRARAITFMLIALTAGLGAAWMVTRYVARHSAPVTAVPLVKVVVASADVPLATTLKAENLKVVDWPTSAQPQGSFTDVAALEGRVTSVAFVAGEPVVEGRLSPKGRGVGMAALIPANMRAMTVHVNDVIGVSGFIHPGDLVDVITTMQAPASRTGGAAPGTPEEYRSKIVLQNIRVLAVGEQLAAEGNKPENVPAVTLLVSPEESERLALASTQGKLQLTMRSQTDDAEMSTPGVSPPELLGSQKVAPAPSASEAVVFHRSAPQRRVAAAPAPSAPAPAAPKSGVDVVEVLRGDRIEERKMPTKGTP